MSHNNLVNDTSFLFEDIQEGDLFTEMKRHHRIGIHFQTYEKLIYAFEWGFLQIFGNCLLWGMIQFDRLGSDPMKRRIIDQVGNTLCEKDVSSKVLSHIST